MKLKSFSNYESVFVPESNDGTSIVDVSCHVPQAVRIKNLLAAGQSPLELLPNSNSYEQHGALDETQTETIPDFADLAEVDKILTNTAAGSAKKNESKTVASQAAAGTAGTDKATAKEGLAGGSEGGQ